MLSDTVPFYSLTKGIHMSIVIKGFVSNSTTKNNLLGRTAVFGELSPYARSFSREILEYGHTDFPNIELNVFHADNNGTAFALESSYSNLLLEIGHWVYERGIILNGSSGSTLQDFVAALENTFSGFVASINASPLVSDGTLKLPQQVSFIFTPNGGVASEVTLWFGVESFEANYDVYNIVVVPPVQQLSVFFQTQQAVQTALASRPIDTMMELVDAAKLKKPPTHISTQTVTWYNISQANQTVQCTWFLLIYGPKGNNSDAISQALTTYILANSTQAAANWKIVMPDLFRLTQFTVLPRWDKYAISPTSIAGIYSPRANVSELLTFAQSKLPLLGNTFVSTNLEVTFHPYRSIQLLAVRGTDNRQGAQSLAELIPDYIGQESLGEDYNRQSEYTRMWITAMGNLLRVAELYGQGAVLGTGMRIVEHLGLECVSMKVRDVEFLVALKRNYAPV